MIIEVSKFHALGNSYLIIEDLNGKLSSYYEKIARILCDKNFGIGSDGLLVINKGNLAKFWMRVFNPDGSEAEISGNGLRITALYLYNKGLVKKEDSLEVGGSKGGRISSFKINDDGNISIEIGKASFLGEKKIKVNKREFKGLLINVGNPHFVVIFDEGEILKLLKKYGQKISNHKDFKEGVNVEFVKVIDEKEIIAYVWERGAGFTLSSGTGASASAFASFKTRKMNNEIYVNLPGGRIKIIIKENDSIILTGPAKHVFTASIDLDKLFSDVVGN